MKQNEKKSVSISIDKNLDSYMDELFSNKSRYIEYLIYQDLLAKGKNVEKIIV